MSRNGFAAVAPLIVILSPVTGVSRQMWAQDGKTQFPSPVPLDQFLMADRIAEIGLSRSAVPTSISSDATVEKSGYRSSLGRATSTVQRPMSRRSGTGDQFHGCRFPLVRRHPSAA
jgi:hypothetical protein